MDRRTKIGASIAAGATAVVAVAAIAVASPSASRGEDATPTPSSTAAAQDPGAQHTPETPLTGTDAEKATAAALKAVPGGTVIRVETDSDGEASYEAHVRKSDGTEVVVLMDDSFNVTTTKEFAGGRGGHGPRGGHGGGNGETALTGADAEKATAAAEEAVEGGTVIRVETDSGGVYEAHVRKSDGTEVVVLMDDSFKVTGVEEFAGRGGHGPDDNDGTDDKDGATSSATPTA